MIKLLLSHDANFELKSSDGKTPLHWAESHGPVEAVSTLIEAGADPMQKNKNGRIAFEIAKAHNNHKIIAYLKDQICDVK